MKCEFRKTHCFQSRHEAVCLTVCRDSKQLENRPDWISFVLAWENVFQWNVNVVTAHTVKKGSCGKSEIGKKRCGVGVCTCGRRGAVISHNPCFPLAGVGCFFSFCFFLMSPAEKHVPSRNVTWFVRQTNEDSEAVGGKKTTSGEGQLTPEHGSLNRRVFSANRLQFKT